MCCRRIASIAPGPLLHISSKVQGISCAPDICALMGSVSPNAEEALSFLSQNSPPTKQAVEKAAAEFLSFGIGKNGGGSVIIRCGALGAYVLTQQRGGQWFDAYWSNADATDHHQVVDVTGRYAAVRGNLVS